MIGEFDTTIEDNFMLPEYVLNFLNEELKNNKVEPIDLTKELKEYFYSNTPILSEFYREALFKNNSPSLYTEDLYYIFEQIQQSISRGELDCIINMYGSQQIKVNECKYIWLQKHTIPFLEYLGYHVFRNTNIGRNTDVTHNKGYLLINPFN